METAELPPECLEALGITEEEYEKLCSKFDIKVEPGVPISLEEDGGILIHRSYTRCGVRLAKDKVPVWVVPWFAIAYVSERHGNIYDCRICFGYSYIELRVGTDRLRSNGGIDLGAR